MFRFTIRDVLWLMVVVGLGVSWWVDNKRVKTAVEALNKERLEQKAEFDDKIAILKDMQKNGRPRFRSIRASGDTSPFDLRDLQ